MTPLMLAAKQVAMGSKSTLLTRVLTSLLAVRQNVFTQSCLSSIARTSASAGPTPTPNSNRPHRHTLTPTPKIASGGRL